MTSLFGFQTWLSGRSDSGGMRMLAVMGVRAKLRRWAVGVANMRNLFHRRTGRKWLTQRTPTAVVVLEFVVCTEEESKKKKDIFCKSGFFGGGAGRFLKMSAQQSLTKSLLLSQNSCMIWRLSLLPASLDNKICSRQILFWCVLSKYGLEESADNILRPWGPETLRACKLTAWGCRTRQAFH